MKRHILYLLTVGIVLALLSAVAQDRDAQASDPFSPLVQPRAAIPKKNVMDFAPSELSHLAGSWASRASMPTARDELAAVTYYDGKIYTLGGFSSSGALATVEVYDPLTNSWSTRTPMPGAKRTVGAALVNGRIYVIGGDNRLFRYDPFMDTWTELAPIPVDSVGEAGVGVVDGKMYVSPGSDWMYCYDPSTGTWTSKTPVPVTRSIESFAALNGKLYAIGGGEPGHVPSEIDRIDVYDPATDSWQIGATATMPNRRTHLGATTPVLSGKIYVIGGWNGYTALSAVDVYDPSTNTWTSETSMLTARYELGTAVANNRIYAIGGNWGGAGGHWQSVNEELTPTDYAGCGGGWEVSNVNLNGQGTRITVAPGASIQVSLSYRLWNPYFCGCIQQIVIGLDNNGLYCAYDSVPATCPSPSGGSDTHTITAPTTPGTYRLMAVNDYNWSCSHAMSNYPNQAEKAVIATVVVYSTPTPTPTCPPPATPEPLWVDPVTSPTSALTQTITVYLGRGRTVTVTSEAGIAVVEGFFDAYTNPAHATIDLLPDTTHHLEVRGRVEYTTGCFYTLSTTQDRHGNPLVIVQQTTPPQCPVAMPPPPTNFQVPSDYYYWTSRGYESGHYNVVGHEVWRSSLQDHPADEYIINTDSDRWWIFVVWNSFGDPYQALLLAPAGTPNGFDRGTVGGDRGFKMLHIKAYVEQCPGASGPDITVTPASVSVTLSQGQGTTMSLKIGNVGDAALTFTIAEESTTAAVSAVAQPMTFPPDKLDPALLAALDTAPNGRATFFVYLQEQADLTPAYAIQDWKARGEYVYRTLRESARSSQKALLADLQLRQLWGEVIRVQPFFILNAIAVTGTRSTVNALAARPEVAYIASEPVYEIPEPIDEQDASATPAGVEWSVAKIRADCAWADFGVTGAGVVVANVDTGVDHTHPALVNQYRGTTSGSHDFNWFDPTGHYPSGPGDNHGHGTHVMGTLVGDDGAGNQIGVAPGARWIAAKGCAGSDLTKAAEWLLAPCPIGVQPGNPTCDASKRPHVVNNSWGGAGGDRWFEATVTAWRAAGIFPAFAAGNSGPGDGTMNSPGDYATSFASGATDQADTICWFSSRGPSRLTTGTKPDLAAPGCKDIRSALPGGSYGTKNGTSMASPHTAGVVALLLQANPGLSVEQIEALLTSTALDLGPEGPDKTYGHGRLDAYAAVAQAGDPVPWLAVNPTGGTVNPGGQQVVTLTLNATGLPTGTHTAELLITSNDPDQPTLTVPVTLSVASGRPVIAHARVSNLRDVSASVSWITTHQATGKVYYGTHPSSLSNVAHDDRGAGTVDDVHHVTIGGLNPNTAYYFYVVSDQAADDNNGQYYRFTTGVPLGVPGSDSVWGRVLKSDGVTPAADVLVYLRVLDNDGQGSLGQSALLSGLTDSNGYWIDAKTHGAINLAAARTEDGQGYFVYSPSGDALRIEVHGGADCDGLTQVDTGDDSPAPDITLSCLNMINLDITTGWSVFVWPAAPKNDYDASDLLGAILGAGGDVPEISRWVAELGNWSGHLRGLPFGDFQVAPGEPYFLRSTRRSLLRLEAGVGIAESEVITLTTGWNFAALPRTTGVISASVACGQIAAQGGSVKEIDRWEANVGNWAAHICGTPIGDFQVTPDQGYFIKSLTDSTWQPAGTTAASTTADRRPQTAAKAGVSSRQWAGGSEVRIRHVQVTNVMDRSFSVLWETDGPAAGEVRFGSSPALGSVAYDDRGADVSAQAHHVTVAGLNPNTTYYFAVVSGATVDDNGGQLYRVTTGPTLGIPGVETAYGRVLQADGNTPAAGVLVRLVLEDGDGEGSPGQSAPLSAVTDAQGYWSVNLGAARTLAGDGYFTTDDDDRLAVTAWHPVLGRATRNLRLGDLSAALPLEMTVSWRVYLPFVGRR